VTPAPELVGDDVIVGVVDHEQLAVVDLGTVDQSCIVGSSLTAPTAGFDLNLDPFVGHLEETLGTGEQFSLKAGEQPEGEHVGAEVVNDPGQLVDLGWQVELRLIAHQVVDASPPGGHGQRHLEEIEPWTDLYGVG
tara:strand:- start:685 stop:1092 length:408 start_codon:yes stop_codon:yes gene_type:complete